MAVLTAYPAPIIRIDDAGGYRVGLYQSLESAAAGLAASGGEIYLGPGTYTIDRVFELNKSKTVIRGSGPSTILVCSGTRSLAQTAIVGTYAKTYSLRGLYITADNITLRDLTVRLPTPTPGSVMLANVGDFNTFNNVRFELTSVGSNNDPYFGIANLGTTLNTVYNTRITDCDFVGGDDCVGTVGFYDQASVGSKIRGSSFGPTAIGTNGILKYCIQHLASSKTVISDCTFLELHGTGSQPTAGIYSDSDSEGQHLNIHGNYFENIAAPSIIEMLGGRFSVVSDNVFGRMQVCSGGVIRVRAAGGLSGGTAQSGFDLAVEDNQFHNQGSDATNSAINLDSVHSATVCGNNVTICPNFPQIVLGSNTKRIKMSSNQVVFQRTTSSTAITSATASGSGLIVNLVNPSTVSGAAGDILVITTTTGTPGNYQVTGVSGSAIQIATSCGASASITAATYLRGPQFKVSGAWSVNAAGLTVASIVTTPTAFTSYALVAGDYLRIVTATGAVVPGVYAIATANAAGGSMTLSSSCGATGTITAGEIYHEPIFACTHTTSSIESDITNNSAVGYADFINPLTATPTDSVVTPNHAALTYTSQT